MVEAIAILSTLIANIYRDRRKHSEAFKPSDFWPKLGEPELPEPAQRTQTWEDQLRMVEMWNAAFGGSDLRKQPQAPSEVKTK